MKQSIFIFLLLLIPFFPKGQGINKDIRYQVTAGTGIPMSTPSTVPFALQGEVLYAFGNRLMAGAGTGCTV